MLCIRQFMAKIFEISKNEMIEALNRSGYLLESEISSFLANQGFFVETNQVIEDPITGKSREIDLIAEYYEYKQERSSYKCASKINFVFEIKNNIFPIVLLTQFSFTPNIEDWMGLKEALTVPEKIDYDSFDSYYENLINKSGHRIYTQYCSFHKKKENDELMALHPEVIYSGLMKITYFCEKMVETTDRDLIYENNKKDEIKDDYFRHFLYLPVLLINDNLFELKNGELEETEFSILVHNYHYKNVPKMAYVFVVTKKGFSTFLNSMLKLEDEIEQKMIKTRKSTA